MGHGPDFGSPDGCCHHLWHKQLCTAGNVRTQNHVHTLLQQLAHWSRTAAQIQIGIGTVNHRHAVIPHGRPLPAVAVDTVGHQRPRPPQAVLVVRLPILGTIRVQLPDPGNFRVVFAQMGLDRQAPLPGQVAQPRHQLIGTGRRKPGRQNGLDMAELLAALQPPQRLPLRFLRGLLEVDAAVAVHIDLSHISCDAGPFQLLHQYQCGVRMEGGKHGHPGSAAVDQRFCQPLIDRPGIVQVRKPCLQGECIGVEPVQQGQIHTHAHLGELGPMEMQVREGLQNQSVSIIRHRLLAAGQLRQTFQNGALFIQP